MGRGKIKSRDPFAKKKAISKDDDKYNLPPDPKDLDNSHISRSAQRTMMKIKGVPNEYVLRKQKMKQQQPKLRVEMREGESLKRFTRRINAELSKRLEVINSEKKLRSEKKREYAKARRQKQKEKKMKATRDAELDRIADGEVEDIPFGEVVTRPPEFDIIPKPAEKKKEEKQMLRMVELAKMLSGKAKIANSDESKAVAPAVEETKTHAAKLVRRKPTPEERAALIEKAKQQAHEAEVARHREQVMAAYRALREKKMHGHKGMSSLNKDSLALLSGVRYSEYALDKLRENN